MTDVAENYLPHNWLKEAMTSNDPTLSQLPVS